MGDGMEVRLQVPEERISKLDIEEFVQSATWRELLIELVDSNRLNPWDIDISKMLEGYLAVIKKMRVLDLRVPANIILAASILLRLKSESLRERPPEQEEVAEQEFGRPAAEVPLLFNKMRQQPARKITLQELMAELETAMKIEEKRRHYTEELQAPIRITVMDDIDERRASVLALLNASADRLGMATFSALAAGFQGMDERLLKLFIPLLFLANDQVVTLEQEEVFGEIIVRLRGWKGNSRSGSTRTQ